MASGNNSTLKIMALGRHCELGMLYDFRADSFLRDTSLWDRMVTSNNINCQALSMKKCELHIKDTFTENADLLGIDDNQKLSVLTGLVDITDGSAKLIDDRKTTNHNLRFILKYSITTQLRSLTMAYSSKNYVKDKEVFDQQTATHVVTDILEGAEIYFVFNRTVSVNENSTKIREYVKNLLKKIGTFHISEDGQLNWENDERALAETLTCQYYSDSQLESNPTTFEQVAKLYKQLPTLIGEHIVPREVSIYPLYLLDDSRLTPKKFHQIDHEILSKSLKLVNSLHQLQITLNDLKDRVSSIEIFYRTEEELGRSITQMADYERNMKEKIMKLLPEIRGGSREEAELTNLLNNLDLSPVGSRKLNDWIGFKTEETNIFKGFLYNLRKQGNINILAGPFSDVQKNFNREFILCLIIHVTEKNDSFLNELLQLSNDNTNQQNNQNVIFDYWYNQDNLILIKEQIAAFIKLAKDNVDKQNMEFIVNEEYTNEFRMRKGVTTILYKNGVRHDFEIPSKLGRPYAADVSSKSVTLSWPKPEYGSGSIQRYKIYGRTNSNDPWKLLLTTRDAAESAVIRNIKPTKYQFIVQGITLIGDTDESDASNIINVPAAQPIAPISTVMMSAPSPVVNAGSITSERAIVDVTPAWYEPVKLVPPDKILLPASYNKNSPEDVRTYNCLATYRSMMEKTENIDFVAKPFTSGVDNAETLVVVLNELANQLGARLTFTNADFKYNDSDYRTACGVTNLGSIHSCLASDGQFQTAKFDLHLKLDYGQITASPETLQNFVLTAINDIASIAGCKKEFVRVFAVKRVASSMLHFGITAPQLEETESLAELVKDELNKPSTRKRKGIFKDMFEEQYDYKLEPALTFIQLQQSDFEPRYNIYYTEAIEVTRGGLPYNLPKGWYRHALKVDDKYGDDKLWLGMANLPGEWAVAYHGTSSGGVRSITDKGLLQEFFTRDACKNEAIQQNPSIPDVKGIYVATHCDGGAAIYSTPYNVKDSMGEEKEYKVVFQCRVEPGKFTEHTGVINEGKAWRVFDEKAIRPYGLLLKSS